MKFLKIKVYFKPATLVNLLFWLAILVLISKRIPTYLESLELQGQSTPHFYLKTLDGKSKEWPKDFSKPIIFIFWATWCEPCKIEMNRYNKAIINNEIPTDAVYGINMGENIDLVKSFLNKYSFNFLNLVDSSGKSIDFFKIKATPTVVFINKDQTIEWIATGISPTAIMRARNLLNK